MLVLFFFCGLCACASDEQYIKRQKDLYVTDTPYIYMSVVILPATATKPKLQKSEITKIYIKIAISNQKLCVYVCDIIIIGYVLMKEKEKSAKSSGI